MVFSVEFITVSSFFSFLQDVANRIAERRKIKFGFSALIIFTDVNFDAQPIKIVQDGNVELLLEKETVTAILVDGANNKWVGTKEGGLYCFSSDGLTQLYHFTKETRIILRRLK